MRVIVLVFSLLMTSIPALAAAPREDLQGIWVFKQGRGGPCEKLILTLRYSFRRDGSYEASSDVRTPTGSGFFTYKGRYVATDSSVTAYVDGTTVGPYPYRIVDDRLIIRQPEHNCEVEMMREDY